MTRCSQASVLFLLGYDGYKDVIGLSYGIKIDQLYAYDDQNIPLKHIFWLFVGDEVETSDTDGETGSSPPAPKATKKRSRKDKSRDKSKRHKKRATGK